VKERVLETITKGGLPNDRAVFIAFQVFYFEAVGYQAVVLPTGTIRPPSVCYDKSYHRGYHRRRKACTEGEDILVAWCLAGVAEVANIGRVIQRTVNIEDNIGTGVLAIASETTELRSDGRDAPCRLTE